MYIEVFFQKNDKNSSILFAVELVINHAASRIRVRSQVIISSWFSPECFVSVAVFPFPYVVHISTKKAFSNIILPDTAFTPLNVVAAHSTSFICTANINIMIHSKHMTQLMIHCFMTFILNQKWKIKSRAICDGGPLILLDPADESNNMCESTKLQKLR